MTSLQPTGVHNICLLPKRVKLTSTLQSSNWMCWALLCVFGPHLLVRRAICGIVSHIPPSSSVALNSWTTYMRMLHNHNSTLMSLELVRLMSCIPQSATYWATPAGLWCHLQWCPTLTRWRNTFFYHSTHYRCERAGRNHYSDRKGACAWLIQSVAVHCCILATKTSQVNKCLVGY